MTDHHSKSIDEYGIIVEIQISLKDHHMIHMLLKMSKNLDQNTLHISKEAEEKSKGFAKLEHHKCLLILNATESNIHSKSAGEPTELCRAFLVYRIKEALHQGRLSLSLPPPMQLVYIQWTYFGSHPINRQV
jgi:hypothetical protein